MDILTAVLARRSCRAFLPDPVAESDITAMVEAAIAAPSPLNAQPWNFVVITNADVKVRIAAEAVRYKAELHEKSRWKWLEKFSIEYLAAVPVMIAVFGNPRKSGADIIMEGAPGAWREACGAAIQNMMLTATSRGLSTLWFTMFDKTTLKTILGVEGDAVPLTVVMVGKAAEEVAIPPRRKAEEVTRYLR